MRLSKKNKEILTDEFAFIIDQMKNSEDPEEMLYYYSAVYGILRRIVNLEFSQDLLFAYLTTEKTYQTIMERFGAMKMGKSVATFHENFGPKFIEYTEELMTGFFDSKLRLKSLTKIVTLAYTTTGNGFYLTKKGMIDIFDDKKELKDK